MLVPIALALIYKKLILVPPQGSVIVDAGRVGAIAIRKRSWEAAKPSVISQMKEGEKRLKKYEQWDDEFVTELRVTLKVCKVSPVPIFSLSLARLASRDESREG